MYYRVAGSDSEAVFFGLAVDPGRQSLAKGSTGTVFDAADPVHPVGDAAGIRDFGAAPFPGISMHPFIQLAFSFASFRFGWR